MKIRTDFVTNSSSSSFIAFYIKNEELYKFLRELGVESSYDNGDGTFEYSDYGDDNEIEDLIRSDRSLITPWLMRAILRELKAENSDEDDWLRDGLEKGLKEGMEELIPNWDKVKDELQLGTWQEFYENKFEEFFGSMDASISEASIETAEGFEGDVHSEFIEISNGKKYTARFDNQELIKQEDGDGVTFVVMGKLEYFENRDAIVEAIEEMGGNVSDSVTKNTDYLICNDLRSTSSKMKKAAELGVPILTEAAFIRRFLNAEEFEDLMPEEDLYDAAWEQTEEGNIKEFIFDNGLDAITIETWQDGKWVNNHSQIKAKKTESDDEDE